MDRKMTEPAMPQISRKWLFVQGFAAGAAIGLCLGLVLTQLQYGNQFVTRYLIEIAGALLLLCLAVVVLILIFAIMPRLRPAANRFPAAGFGMIAVLAVMVPSLTGVGHERILANEKAHAAPVVAALKSFQAQNGRPAGSVARLFPEYLPKSPSPLTEFCSYQYKVLEPSADSAAQENDDDSANRSGHRETWEFSIHCVEGWLFTVEALVYRPDGKYDADPYAWDQRPNGDWMYYYLGD